MSPTALLLIAAQGSLTLAWHQPRPAQPLPERWPSAAAARAAGCRAEAVFGSARETCVVEQVDDMARIASLTVYERGEGGTLTRASVLCLPSYHQRARFAYLDLLGNGQALVLGEFEGNTGTDTSQTILIVVVWNEKSPRLSLLESVAYRLGAGREQQSLSADYSFLRSKDGPEVRLTYQYRTRPPSRRDARQWTEVLTWDAPTLSFYGRGAEGTVASNDVVRSRVADARRRSRVADLRTACEDPRAILQTGIMDVMPAAAHDGQALR